MMILTELGGISNYLELALSKLGFVSKIFFIKVIYYYLFFFKCNITIYFKINGLLFIKINNTSKSTAL